MQYARMYNKMRRDYHTKILDLKMKGWEMFDIFKQHKRFPSMKEKIIKCVKSFVSLETKLHYVS